MIPLTSKERELLALVGRGLRCREIAMMLGIAPFTVRKHRCNTLGKLGLHSTMQLVACEVRMSSLPDDALDRTDRSLQPGPS